MLRAKCSSVESGYRTRTAVMETWGRRHHEPPVERRPRPLKGSYDVWVRVGSSRPDGDATRQSLALLEENMSSYELSARR